MYFTIHPDPFLCVGQKNREKQDLKPTNPASCNFAHDGIPRGPDQDSELYIANISPYLGYAIVTVVCSPSCPKAIHDPSQKPFQLEFTPFSPTHWLTFIVSRLIPIPSTRCTHLSFHSTPNWLLTGISVFAHSDLGAQITSLPHHYSCPITFPTPNTIPSHFIIAIYHSLHLDIILHTLRFEHIPSHEPLLSRHHA